ncbi:hypothetical protein DMA12_23480 [Amycolatopsis balhimycina DSM 5908]|uniref:Uncharacterized protein n=1 Tax=Amycolatopsis balhimycina DSM 5908 TaxID=1081091 RepID=A0A428WFN6_AMYBA|nr:hypothetical protein DMA12_23480 [Amycolatopsis balhimycina DSM 5908]
MPDATTCCWRSAASSGTVARRSLACVFWTPRSMCWWSRTSRNAVGVSRHAREAWVISKS